MRTTKTTTTATIAIFFFCLAVFTAQASLVQTLLNHTSLRGNMKLNTTEGVDFNYNASLGFNSDYGSFEVANLMTKFAAKHANGSKDVEYDYDGAIVVNHLGQQTNATVKGVADIDAEVNGTKGNNTNCSRMMVNANIRNKNNWSVRAGKISASGKHNASLNASWAINQNGDKIFLHERVQGVGLVNGSIRYNKSNSSNFMYIRGGQVDLHEGIMINPQEEEHSRSHKYYNSSNQSHPNATFFGKTKFMDFSGLMWNNQTYNVARQGEDVFGGESWINATNDTNGFYTKVLTDENDDFRYKNEVYQNGHKLGFTLIKGGAAYEEAIGTSHYNNGTIDVVAANYGDAGEKWIAFPNQHGRNGTKFMKMKDELIMGGGKEGEEEEGGEHHHGNHSHHDQHDHYRQHKNVTGILGGSWKAGVHYRSDLNNATGDRYVDVKSGIFYDINGSDTKSKQPWEINDNRTSQAHFNITNNGSKVENITVNTDKDSSFLYKMSELTEKMVQNFLA